MMIQFIFKKEEIKFDGLASLYDYWLDRCHLVSFNGFQMN